MNMIKEKQTAAVMKQYKQVNKQVAKYNEKHDPLCSVPKRYLYAGKGLIPFGNKKGSLVGLREGLDGHGVIIGGSGTGKTSCFAIPTLLFWHKAIVCTDVKGELSDWYKFFRCRKMVRRPELVFDPEDKFCPHYDPFWLISEYPDDKSAIISSITKTLIPVPRNIVSEHDFWTKSAQLFLKAAILFHYNLKMSFMETIKSIQTTPIPELWNQIKTADNEANELISQNIDKNPYLLTSIDVDIHNALEVFSDPYISRAFDGRSAVFGNMLTWDKIEDYNIFLKIPSEKIKYWKPAFNILYTQLIFTLNKRKDKYSYNGRRNIQTLLLMDEFASFGAIPFFEEDTSTLRSKGVNIFLVLQSLAQLDRIYGADARKEIMDNCSHNIIFGCNDADTKLYLTELIGTRKMLKASISMSCDKGRDMNTISQSIDEVRANIVEPHELAQLINDIIVVSDGFPFRLKKLWISDELRREFYTYTRLKSETEDKVLEEFFKILEEKMESPKEKMQRLATEVRQSKQNKIKENAAYEHRRIFAVGQMTIESLPDVPRFIKGRDGIWVIRLSRFENLIKALSDSPAVHDFLASSSPPSAAVVEDVKKTLKKFAKRKKSYLSLLPNISKVASEKEQVGKYNDKRHILMRRKYLIGTIMLHYFSELPLLTGGTNEEYRRKLWRYKQLLELISSCQKQIMNDYFRKMFNKNKEKM